MPALVTPGVEDIEQNCHLRESAKMQWRVWMKLAIGIVGIVL